MNAWYKVLFPLYDSLVGVFRDHVRVCSCCRHPQAHLRPDFSDVRAALRQSQSSVLEWASEDMTKDPLSLHLGAPLVHGKALFMDLQSTYVQ